MRARTPLCWQVRALHRRGYDAKLKLLGVDVASFGTTSARGALSYRRTSRSKSTKKLVGRQQNPAGGVLVGDAGESPRWCNDA
ncbi:MAG: hypothetical protein ACLR9W_03820 [Enterobacter hormaechei]